MFLISISITVPGLSIEAPPESDPIGNGPWIINTFEEDNIEITLLERGLKHPFGLIHLPGTGTDDNPAGDVLIAEREGSLRLIRDGHLLSSPVNDLSQVIPLHKLFDIELHPQFSSNQYIYFSWIKRLPHPDGTEKLWTTTALSRGVWSGRSLINFEELFVADAWTDNPVCGASSRLHFLVDGTLVIGVSHCCDLEAPQDLGTDIGKILRLNDDGSIPEDNPFVGIEGGLPEIYALGIRSSMDFVTHAPTGDLWELQNGPQGGDEINIIRPGRNYGWPQATFGRDYGGTLLETRP